MNKLFIAFLILAFAGISNVQAQEEQRAASPSAKLVQKVGLTDITIEYSRPSMKDRKIFAADGLVPFGKSWRTGANAATKITFSDAVKIGDGELAAGSYAILTTPGESTWDVNFYPFEGAGAGSYAKADPAVTMRVAVVKNAVSVESFLITIDGLRDYSASIVFAWENTVVSLPITVN